MNPGEDVFREAYDAVISEREAATKQLTVVMAELKSRASRPHSPYLADVIEHLEVSHRRLLTIMNALSVVALSCISEEEKLRISAKTTG